MDAAWEFGITHFDTADAYGGGRSERAIGRWIAVARGPAAADDQDLQPDAGRRGPRPEARSGSPASCASSLERLGVDQVELYLAHEFDPDVPLAETLGAFDAGPGRRPDRRLRGEQLRRRPAGGRAGGGRAAGRSRTATRCWPAQDEQDLLTLCAERQRRLPGVRPARRRLAHRQVPPRRAVPGRVADDPATRAVHRVRHRPRPSTRSTGCRRSPRAAASRWPGSRSPGCSPTSG